MAATDRLSKLGLHLPRMLLPDPSKVDFNKWATIACDQYTSSKAYWKAVEDTVGTAPSMLHLIYPEIYLDPAKDDEYTSKINANAKQYLADGTLVETQPQLVLVDRSSAHFPSRRGLIVAVDLECYSWAPDSQTLIRATEKTIEERLPPRIKIRSACDIESPHIIILIDDDDKQVIEPLFDRADKEPLYDFELMRGGGHLKGWSLRSDAALEQFAGALEKLADRDAYLKKYGIEGADASVQPLLMAIGDGNHSLATAKKCWEAQKASGAAMDHPARFALVELQNIHDPGQQFEPIHRLLLDVPNVAVLIDDLKAAMAPLAEQVEFVENGKIENRPGQHQVQVKSQKLNGVLVLSGPKLVLDCASLTQPLDALLKAEPALKIDFVHGEEDIDREVADSEHTLGLLLPGMDISSFFLTCVRDKVLPRKTFSMGHADDKRFYFECRKIK